MVTTCAAIMLYVFCRSLSINTGVYSVRVCHVCVRAPAPCRCVHARVCLCADMLVLTSLQYGVADAEITVPSAENPDLSKALFFNLESLSGNFTVGNFWYKNKGIFSSEAKAMQGSVF